MTPAILRDVARIARIDSVYAEKPGDEDYLLDLADAIDRDADDLELDALDLALERASVSP